MAVKEKRLASNELITGAVESTLFGSASNSGSQEKLDSAAGKTILSERGVRVFPRFRPESQHAVKVCAERPMRSETLKVFPIKSQCRCHLVGRQETPRRWADREVVGCKTKGQRQQKGSHLRLAVRRL